MGKVYITVGIPGSGKSTYIKKHYPNLPVVCRDKIRAELGYTSSDNQKALLSKEAEQHVSEIQYQSINYYCQNDMDFVIDGINNRKIYRHEILNIIRSYPNMKVICIRFQTPLETCISRRAEQISQSIMEAIYSSFEELDGDEYDQLLTVE